MICNRRAYPTPLGTRTITLVLLASYWLITEIGARLSMAKFEV